MRIIFFIIVVGIVSCKEPTKPKKTPPLEKSIGLVKMRLTELNDQPINLSQFKGKTIFINLWATWCKPCLQEMPSIKNARDLLSKNDVIFLLASNESPDQINEFKKDHDYNLKYVRLVNMEELNVEGLPTTYIYNPQGELAYSEMGYRKWDDPSNIEMILKINGQK